MEPKIRFKGYSGDWKNDVIGNIATFSKGRGYSKGDLKSVGNPIILYGRLYTNYSSIINNVDTFASLKKGSVLSKGKEVIIPGSGETPEDIAIASAVEQKDVILGGDLNVITFDEKKIIPPFAAMCITNSKTHYELSGYAQGKTVVHLHNSGISKGHLSYPSKDEQQAIVLYLSSLDKLIKSTSKKVESLKKLKSASLVTMFPQQGETTPKVRFKGFEEEWIIKSFKELYKRSSIKNDLSYDSSKIISVANMYFKEDNMNTDEAYLLTYNVMKLGDIAFEGNKSKSFAHGRFVENSIGNGIVSHVFVVFSPLNEDYDIDFWKYYINNEQVMGSKLVRCTKSSTMMTDLVVDDFLKETILVPSLEEQQELGRYFATLDRKIALETARLEKLKQIKRACLDKMFV